MSELLYLNHVYLVMAYDILSNQVFMDEVFAGDRDLAIETLQEFLVTIDDDYACLVSFSEDKECTCEDVKKLLHRIKPSLYFVGLQDIYQETVDFMDMLHKSDVKPDRQFLKDYLGRLKNNIEEVRAYASQF